MVDCARVLPAICVVFAVSGPESRADEPDEAEAVVVVAEGERFSVADDAGWRVTHQDQSYATQAFGGMWATHGGLLGASVDSAGSVAVSRVRIPETAGYRVWSKYQSPPYFNFPHRIEIHQGGRRVFAHDYGKLNAERMYSFCGETVYGLPPKRQIWFTWGVDHDAAEAPRQMARLNRGDAEIRLITLPSEPPSGDRFVDFVLLTDRPGDTCVGWEKHGQAKSPFMFEAIRATPIYVRFKNVAARPAKAQLFTHFGHVTWHCAPKRALIPERPVAPGQWSEWVDVNRVVELFTDEGLRVTLVDAADVDADGRNKEIAPLVGANTTVPVEVSLDDRGRALLGAVNVPNGQTIHFPLDVTWNREKKLRLSRDVAAELIEQSKTEWRKAAEHKPRYIAFFGNFERGNQPWAVALKDALGYNTQLPEGREHLPVDGYHQHLRNERQIRDFAETLGAKRAQFRVCSLGDEISLGGIDHADAKYVEPFRAWLKRRGLTRDDLGIEPSRATLAGNRRLEWYARLFGAEQRFAHYRHLTETARRAFGPQVLTGANYSPHHDVLYFGNQLQWVDAFKHRAMSMFWTEDYIFFAPELPQTISFLMARAHSAVKYHGQPIHMYVMPHAPGQPADYFRRNMLLAIGAGARHVDNFWVAPQENYSENYVSWQYPETFRAIFESIHDTAAAEPLLIDARRRPGRVAVVTGKATALNEDGVEVKTADDRFLAMCHLTARPVQNVCRKDQQLIYLALRNAQYQVDLITEDDIVEDGVLARYRAVYFAGEWIDDRAVPKLDAWVRDGGVLLASTGLGHLNQFGEKHTALLELAGVSTGPPRKNLYHHRPLLELPLAEPIDSSHPDDLELAAIAFVQKLRPTAPETRVLVRWRDGSGAVTERALGRGRVFAVGTALGATFWRTALEPVPWARGGRENLYNPTDFSPSARRIMNLAVDTAVLRREAVCSTPGVESFLLDNDRGTLLTLINWTNRAELDGVRVSVKVPFAPREIKSVTNQTPLEFKFTNGRATFDTHLREGDFIMLMK